MYYIYILQSEKDHKHYIGQTNDIKRRLGEHNRGKIVSTRRRRPFTLIRSEIFLTRSEAMKREKYLKALKGGNEYRRILAS